MVSEVNAGPESKEGPVLKPPRRIFHGIAITRGESYQFGICCEAIGLNPAGEDGWVFIIDSDGLTLLRKGRQYPSLPWHAPSEG